MSTTEKTPADPPAALLLPNGTRLTREVLRLARLSLPPIRCRDDPPWLRPPVRLYPVLDGEGDLVGEVWIWWERGLPRFGRSHFVQSFRKEMNHDQCGEVSLAAQDRNWARVHALDPIALPWFCPD